MAVVAEGLGEAAGAGEGVAEGDSEEAGVASGEAAASLKNEAVVGAGALEDAAEEVRTHYCLKLH